MQATSVVAILQLQIAVYILEKLVYGLFVIICKYNHHEAWEYLIYVYACVCVASYILSTHKIIHNSKHISTCEIWHTLLLCKAT